MSSFIDALQNLTTQHKARMEVEFIQVETTIRCKLAQILEFRIQLPSHGVDFLKDIIEVVSDVSTQFLEMREN